MVWPIWLTRAFFTVITLIVTVMDVAIGQDSTTSQESQSPLLTADDGKIVQCAVRVFSQRHLLHPAVDDALSEKMMDRFVQSWDPQKLYFLKADITDFETQKTQLDDQLLAGNVEFANVVFLRFRQRTTERLSHVGQWINAEHDFTVNESLTTDATQLDWATTVNELEERWRKQVKYELLLLKLKGYDTAESRLRLQRHYSRTQALSNQVEQHELLERYLTSLAKSIDPDSQFLSEATMAQYHIGVIRMGSIGMKIVEQDGYLVVKEVISGGSAEECGEIEAGDRLIGIADKSAKGFLDVWNMKLDAVDGAIRGPFSTTVQVQILKPTDEIEVHTLKRADFSPFTPDEQSRSCIIESSDWIAGTNARIGVLKIPAFYRDYEAVAYGKDAMSTSRDVRHILQQFNSENLAAVVVDLRGNSGGSLSEVLDVCRSIAGDGPMVQVTDSEDQVTLYQSDELDDRWKTPVLVVCDLSTAGNAELLAAAIQDYQRGILIGNARTRGRGTVQIFVDVNDSTSRISPSFGCVKATIAALFRVNGNSIQHAGVAADIILPSFSEILDSSEKPFEDAMNLAPIPPAKYTPFTKYVNDSIIEQMSKRSSARVLNSPDFRIVKGQIQRHINRKNEKSVSLNQTDAAARMKELKAAADLVSQMGSKHSSDGIFPKNYYNTEVVHIATDYIQLLNAM
ncbi:MAG: carboxy terminal-processing peptidase [Planctomyces sp.]|nr:carboxy terminal-processing peptidase [Planctomyces sp.]